MTKAIATIGSGPMRPVLDLCRQTFEPYATRHGYDFVIGTGDAQGRPPAWGKVPLLRRLLDVYDTVLWIDADAIILDGSRDIADDVPQGSYQGLVKHSFTNGEEYPNTGIWLLRGARAAAFLDEVWASEEFIHHEWWENAAASHLLGYQNRPGRFLAPTAWSDGATWLDGTWNGHVGFVGMAPVRIRHYAGRSNPERIRRMTADLAQVAPRPALRARAAAFKAEDRARRISGRVWSRLAR